jgi:hypothetical protein
LTNDLPPEASREVFAKLNDLVRFLYKNQSTLFAAHHRKPNKEERMEAVRIESRQLKKKRREESAHSQVDKKRKLKEGQKTVDVNVSNTPATRTLPNGKAKKGTSATTATTKD